MAIRLTKPLLEAIGAALDAALAGEGFEGGDFAGMNPKHFERAREWASEQIEGDERLSRFNSLYQAALNLGMTEKDARYYASVVFTKEYAAKREAKREAAELSTDIA